MIFCKFRLFINFKQIKNNFKLFIINNSAMNKQKKLKIIISESQFKRLMDNYDVKEVINESTPKKIKLVKTF